mgnify:CR=1 FL=1
MLNINFWNIAFTIINIVVLYLFLKHFLMKPLMSILEERKQMVEKELDKAAAANRDADLLKKKYEVSLEKADEEAGRIVAQAKERQERNTRRSCQRQMQMLLKSWKMQRK